MKTHSTVYLLLLSTTLTVFAYGVEPEAGFSPVTGSQTAQTSGAVAQKPTATKASVKKTECRRGFIYEVTIVGGDTYVRVAHRPSEKELRDPASLPPARVRYNDITTPNGGKRVIECGESDTVEAAAEAEDKKARAENPLLKKPSDSQSTLRAREYSSALDSKGITEEFTDKTESDPANDPKVPAIPRGPATVDEIAKIAGDARANAQESPVVQQLAQDWQLCRSTNVCGSDLDTMMLSPTQAQIEQKLKSAMREEVSTGIAMNLMYPEQEVRPSSDGSLTTVYGPNGLVAVDNDTGLVFMEARPGSLPTLIGKDGTRVSTDLVDGGWTQQARGIIDTPAKYEQLTRGLFNGPVQGFTPIVNYDIGPVGEVKNDIGLSTFNNQVRTVPSYDSGASTVMDRGVYDGLEALGNEVYGISALERSIADMTQGKWRVTSGAFPQETLGVDGSNENERFMAGTFARRREALERVEKALGVYPPEFWKSPNVPGGSNLVVYPYAPDHKGVKAGGWASTPYRLSYGYADQIYLNPSSDADWTQGVVWHETTHRYDNLFPSNAEWGRSVYGDAYGKVYAGQSGWDAVASNKFGLGRPEGFAREYGWSGGIYEDKATISDSLFKNYGATMEAARVEAEAGNPAFQTKINMIKEGYYKTTNGVMNDTYWENLTPVFPGDLPKPSFLESLRAKLTPSPTR